MRTGNFGIGTSTPARAVHLQGHNANFRMDRDIDTAAFILVRTAAGNFNSVWKTFYVGVNASGVNNGSFFIGDNGTNVAGTSTIAAHHKQHGPSRHRNHKPNSSDSFGGRRVLRRNRCMDCWVLSPLEREHHAINGWGGHVEAVAPRQLQPEGNTPQADDGFHSGGSR